MCVRRQRSSYQKCQKYAISFIKKADIPIKGADCSIMDFFGFGYLKQRVRMTQPKTIRGLARIVQREWSKIDHKLCKKVFDSLDKVIARNKK